MALFDFLKRKKEVKKAAEKKAVVLAKPKPQISADKTPINADTRGNGKKNVGKFSYEIVKEPHISEKGTNLAENSKYIFKVYNNASKLEIKKSVEGIHRVDVLSVNTIRIPAKKRRLGRTEGFRKGYRKAVVTIREGQKIEIL